MNLLQTFLTKIFLISLLLTCLSCRETNEVDFPVGSGDAELTFDPLFSGEQLVLGEEYTTPQEETVRFSRFEYIISNIRLTRANAEIYDVPDAYYFMGQRTPADAMRETIVLEDVPAGDYTAITFSVGVDPETNSSTDDFLAGELEIGVGMDWSWNTGYKFINWEGEYFNATERDTIPFVLHVGTNDNFVTITRTFNTPLVVSETITADAYIEVQADKVFEVVDLNELGLNFTDFTGVMLSPEEKAADIAEQWPLMFEVVDNYVPDGDQN
jgi:hypothetical protein